MPLKSYWLQLHQAATKHGVDLRQAFTDAGLESSVFYRARKGRDLHWSTAKRVMDAILETANQEKAA